MSSPKSLADHIKENHHRFHLFFVLIIATAISLFFFQIALFSRAQISVSPELPRIYLNTDYPSLSSSRTVYNVRSSCTGVVSCFTSLQTAIDQSNQGDEIIIDSGMTISASITLRNKTGSGWIVIRTSDISGIPAPGTRVNPSVHAAAMPKVLSPGSNLPALKTAPGAHHYRIVGIEFGKVSPSVTVGELISLGDNSLAQNTLDTSIVPHNIILDRIYAHGDPTSALKRGVGLNSASSAIIDSYISDFHVIGQDAQAIAGANGPGPYKIVNNYLEGAGENVIFGGDDPKIPNLIPSDIEFRRNHLSKPLSWREGDPSYAGYDWVEKNLFELKNSQRVLVDGNLMEYSWVDGQEGYAVLFNTTNQGGNCSWCAVMDVTFTNNIVRHAASGIQIQGNDWTFPSSSGKTQRIKIENNLFDDIDGNAWRELTSIRVGRGLFLNPTSGSSETGPEHVQVIHNTVLNAGNRILYAGTYSNSQFWTKTGFIFRDNIAYHGTYGIFGDNVSYGSATLNAYFPGADFRRNVLIDIGGVNPSSRYSQHPDNFFPATDSLVQFTDLSGGDYRLAVTSPYHNAATDGLDIGVDFGQLNAAFGAISPTLTPSPTPTSPCTITSATFQQTQVSVGDTLTMTVTVSSPTVCNGQTIVVNLYDEDPFNPDDLLNGPMTQVFNSTGSQAIFTYQLNSQDYIDGGNESGNENIYFTAQLQGQSNYTQSSQINFYNTVAAPTPTPVPTTTLIPTLTPVGSTPTPVPTVIITPTPISTPAPTSTPIITPAPQGGVEPTAFESFDLWKIPAILSGLACYGIRFAIILFAIVLLYAGVRFLMSRGNPTEFNRARKIFFEVLIGGLVVYGVYTIILTLGAYIGYTDLPYLPLNCS